MTAVHGLLRGLCPNLSPCRLLGPSLLLGMLAVAAAVPAEASDRLVPAPPDLATLRLSNIRIDAGGPLGKQFVAFDYEVVKPPGMGDKVGQTWGQIGSVVGAEGEGVLQVEPLRFKAKPKGSVAIALPTFTDAFTQIPTDFEFWIEARQPGGYAYKISNSVRLGNPAASPAVTPLTAAERARYDEWVLVNTPPASLPEGYRAVDRQTPLVPGVPLKAGWRGGWETAEVLEARGDGRVTVRYLDQGDATVVRGRNGWLAIDPEVAARAAERPDSFLPSLALVPGTTTPIPDGFVLVAGTDVPAGLVVRREYFNRFDRQCMVIAESDEIDDKCPLLKKPNKLIVRDLDNTWNRTETVSRWRLLVETEKLADLEDPEVRLQLEKKARATLSRAAKGGAYKLTDHPIDEPIPPGYEIIPADLELKPETKIGVCLFSGWKDAIFLVDHGDDTFGIRYRWVSLRDETVRRDQLVIAKKEIDRLRRVAAMKARREKKEAEEAAARQRERQAELAADRRRMETIAAERRATRTSPLRQWSDASGRFSISARFVSEQDGQVSLLTDQGKRMTIAIAKLSDADRDYLKSLEPPEPETPASPFRPKSQPASNPFRRR